MLKNVVIMRKTGALLFRICPKMTIYKYIGVLTVKPKYFIGYHLMCRRQIFIT